jgi:hypothetical protein
MINGKGCRGFLSVMKKEGKRANEQRDRERECVRGRVSEEREIALVQRSTD